MDDNYIREEKIKEITQQDKEIELLVSIYKTKKEMDEANRNFEYAEGDLIDYYIYKIKGTRAKLDYLIKKAKDYGMEIGMIEQIDIRYNKAI